MSRIIDRPVPVELNPDLTPRAFRYRVDRRVKEVLDHWFEAGEWWDGDGPKEVFRVTTVDGGIFELSREVHKNGSPGGQAKAPGEWRLYKVYD